MKKNHIPTYVKRMLKRASFAIETSHYQKGYDPSYTIIIPKHSIYARAATLQSEVERLAAWAMRAVYVVFPPALAKQNPPVVVRHIPAETHYCKQFAVVDIYDPVMLRVEHLIGTKPISTK